MKLCALCARMGRDCCRFHDITVSTGDVQRIAAFTGRGDFFDFRAPTAAAYLDQDDDPNWLGYVTEPDGTRQMLRQTAQGACVFLTSTGCALPEGVRPLICRLHPLEYSEAGLVGVAAECPIQLLEPGDNLLKNLEIDATVAEGWRKQLYEELKTQRPGGTESLSV